ncbi:MAG TPA: sensory rhodopsin transducer [Lacipirellulaceae bacterium]|nr:sensory rhodopsin transducer [Lacipirellulaceae bacterium]
MNQKNESKIGTRIWAIPEGYIPPSSHGPAPQMTSHEAACILNAGNQDAHVQLMVYFEEKAPVGPYALTIPAKRTRHFRFNELSDPQPIPRGTNYSSLIRSDVPVVVQYTRLDSRQAENALLSTIAFPVPD